MKGGDDAFVRNEIRLAQEAFRSGDLDRAERRINRVYAEHAHRADVLTSKAMILSARGRQNEALDLFIAALEIEPRDAANLAWAAFLCLNFERFGEAEKFARRLTLADPGNPRGHYLLANALRALDRFEEGLAAIDRCLEIQPNDPNSLVTKARLLKAWQLPGLAIEFYRKSMAIRPTPPAAVDLARMLLRESHPDAALEVLRTIEPLMPPAERPHALVAEAYTHLHRFEEAEERWKQASSQSPDPLGLSLSRAKAEIAAGRFSVAEDLLRELITRDRFVPSAFLALTSARKMKADDLPLIERMAAELANGKSSLVQRTDMSYGLGKSFDDLRDFERAIGYFDLANQFCLELYPQRRGYDRDRAKALTDYLIATFTEDRVREFAAKGMETELPLFVVGMMRSGTTLTESILSAHSRVAGAGEQSFWTERVIEFMFSGSGNLAYDHALVQKFAKEYLALVDPKDVAIAHVVDKNPDNIALAGVLNGVFPNARTVHLRRHPVDNVLSIWMTPVSGNVQYASDRENLVFTYREYLRLCEHWSKVLPPDRFATFRYEDLTGAPEDTILAMLQFAGLEAEAACFAPEKNARAVLTPSVYQVRQPIHKGSQERWKNYEPWLGSFAELLGVAS